MPVLIQSKSLSNRFLLSCFMGPSAAMSYSSASTNVTGLGRPFFSSSAMNLWIFPGTQPTNAELLATWASTIRSTILAQFTVTDKFTMFNAYNVSQSTVLPPNIGFNDDNSALSVNASATGTASWALYIADISPTSVNLTTTPYMILPVSLTTGTGIVRMPSVDLTAGNLCQVTFHLYTAGGV